MVDTSIIWISASAIILLMLLLILRQQKLSHLQQILQQTTLDYNQLAEKFDALNTLKNQLEQHIIKAQTESQGLQIRLNERDEKISYLTQELDEEQARHSSIAEQITALKERFGIASAQAESLHTQLQHSQSQLLRKEQEQQHLTEKLTALSQELTGLKTTLKKSILPSNNKISSNPNNSLAWNFKISLIAFWMKKAVLSAKLIKARWKPC